MLSVCRGCVTAGSVEFVKRKELLGAEMFMIVLALLEKCFFVPEKLGLDVGNVFSLVGSEWENNLIAVE